MNLKATINGVFGGEEIDRIIGLPITQLRLRLKSSFSKKKFSAEAFDQFLEDLKKLDPSVEKQFAIARDVVEKREARDSLDIELNKPAKQLLWAAVIARISDAGEEPVVKSKFWSQLINSTGFYNQAISTSRLLMESIQNPDTTFSWGQPGSWFYHNPRSDHVNLDAFYTLLVGFEHIKPIDAHEVGHSENSDEYPKWMQEIYKDILAFIDPEKAADDAEWNKLKEELKKLPDDERIKKKSEILAKVTLWNLSHRAWNCLEDLTVDQFAIDMRQRMRQDYGDNINHAATILRGYAEIVTGQDKDGLVEVRTDSAPVDFKEEKKKDKKDQVEKMRERIQGGTASGESHGSYIGRPLTAKEIAEAKAGNISPNLAYKMYNQVTWGGLFSGYIKNGLMSDTAKSWERMRIFRQDIDALVDVSGIPAAQGLTASQYLFKLCCDDKDSIRVNKPTALDRVSMRPDCKTLDGSYKKTLKEKMDARNAKMQHIYEVYLKPYMDVLTKEAQQKIEQEMKKNKEKGEEQDQDQNGEGGQEGQEGQGQGEPGEGSGGGGESMPDPFDDARDQISKMGKNASGQREKDQKGDQDAKPGKDKKDGKDKKKSGWDQDPDYDKKPQKNKVGDMKDRTSVNEELTEEQKEKMRQDAKEAGEKAKSSLNGGQEGGHSRGTGNLGAMAKASWADYQRRKMELAPIINQLAASFKRIRDEQMRTRSTMGTTYDYMPEDGDVIDRMDSDRILERKIKESSGRDMTTDDLKTFREDQIKKLHASIELFIMIDGSSSMGIVNLGNGTTAMETSMQCAVILYEAALLAGIDPYIVMWGDAVPTIIATPKTPPREVGRILEHYRNGTNSGTELRPGLESMINELANFRNGPDAISGSSHIAVLSDGDLASGDTSPTIEGLKIISKNNKRITVDVAVLKANGTTRETNMETAINAVTAEVGDKTVGLMVGNDANRIPLDLGQKILRRVRSYKVPIEPDTQKRRYFKQLRNKLDT